MNSIKLYCKTGQKSSVLHKYIKCKEEKVDVCRSKRSAYKRGSIKIFFY